MEKILDEFEFLINDTEEQQTTFEEDSQNNIKEAEKFLNVAKQYPNRTYQGIFINAFASSIKIGKSDIVPWEHVCFTLDVNKMKDMSNGKLEEIILPSFIEELCSIGYDNGNEFGYNQAGRNRLRFIEIPSSVFIIASGTFALYKKLEKVRFSKNSRLIYLGSQAFVGCEMLHKLDLSNCEDLDEIRENTFSNSGIQTLIINSNIRKICNIEDTNIKHIQIDDVTYSIEKYKENMSLCTNGVFWEKQEYDF